jgi:hypothetical protein
MMPGWNWHLTLKPKFNRLPWCHRASPSTTRYESVKSTDADRLMQISLIVKKKITPTTQRKLPASFIARRARSVKLGA